MLNPAVDADLRARGLVPAPKQDEPFGMDFEGAHISCPWGYEGAMTPEEMYTYTQLTADERVQFLAAAAENGYVAEDYLPADATGLAARLREIEAEHIAAFTAHSPFRG
jgi:hypothetical protein